ncbi:MAG: hypothetical protein ACRD0H_00630, partial [Actinomycetes bacterium]
MAVACCLGPGVAAVVGGAGIAAWLGAGGAWPTAAAVGLVAGAVGVMVVAHRRGGCPAPGRAQLGPGPGGVAILPDRRGEARGAALPPAQRELYRWILSELAAGRVPDRAGIDRHSVAAVDAMAAMAAMDLVHLDTHTSSVRCAYPFSGVPTAHLVRLEGSAGARAGPVHAMCAVDELGIP